MLWIGGYIMNQPEMTLDKLYNENTGYTKFCFDVYRKIYNLDTVKHEEQVSKELFDYCQNRTYFVLLLLYNDRGQVFLQRNMQDKLYWELVGRGIRPEETIFETIQSLAYSINKSVSISDVEPIVFVQNIFKYKNKVHIHEGLAFAARVRNSFVIEGDSTVKGAFVESTKDEIDRINRPANKKAVEYFFNRYLRIQTLGNIDFQNEEIDTNEKYKGRYLIHENFVKKYILTKKRKRKEELNKILETAIGSAKSILDISCGDDNYILELSRKYPDRFDYIVGNDISWSQVESISSKREKNDTLIFSNHNAVFCPFAENSFDVVLCKNTLHHMPNRNYLSQLLRKMIEVGKKVVIVEIEDPEQTGGLPRFIHRNWYVRFLHDVGDAYLNERDFKTLVESAYEDYNVEYTVFNNIQGRYHIAVVEKDSHAILEKRLEDKLQQIQEKFILEQDVNDFISAVLQSGYKFSHRGEERDIYFSDIKGDFISNRVCLRTRMHEDKPIQILYKDDPYRDKKYIITEGVDCEINNKYETNFINFLEKLNYHKYCTVNKHRAEYTQYDGDIIYKIFIDNFDGKNFVEFMVMTKNNWTREDLIDQLDKRLADFRSFSLTRFNDTYRDYHAQKVYNSILPLNGLQAILIDLDGTLIPSEKVFYDCWVYIAEKYYNCFFSIDEYIEHELRQDHQLIVYLKASGRLNENVDTRNMMNRVYKHYNSAFKKMLFSHDSSPELSVLQGLHNKGIRLGLVTTSKKEYVDMFLDVYKDFENIFDTIITRFDVEERKPSGEAYIKAAKDLNVDTDRCLVIEDSPKGIEAGNNAGMKSIAVSQHTVIDLKTSGIIVPVFDNVVEIALIINKYYEGGN